MKKRVLAVAEIKKRIADVRVALGIKTFRQNVSTPLKQEELNVVLLLEGIDEVVEKSARGARGLPYKRLLEVILEIIILKTPTSDIYKICHDLREVVLVDPFPVKVGGKADATTFISELRVEGPSGYGLPDVEGIRLVLGLNYIDDGTY